MSEDDLLAIEDVATLLRMPIATLRFWRYSNTGPRSFRVGRRVKYVRADVEEWVRQQREVSGK